MWKFTFDEPGVHAKLVATVETDDDTFYVHITERGDELIAVNRKNDIKLCHPISNVSEIPDVVLSLADEYGSHRITFFSF